MNDPINLFNDPRITHAIKCLHYSDDDEAEVPELDVVLIRIRATLNSEMTFAIGNPDASIAGFGVRCYNEPNQIIVTSIVSGFNSIDQLSPVGGGIDVAYFSVESVESVEDALCPFDLGCFSSLAPLTISFEPIVKGAKLEMILVGQRIEDGKIKAIDWPTPPVPVKPEPLGDPGWTPIDTRHSSVAVFEDVSPLSHDLDLQGPDAALHALHGVIGTVARRGPFALQIWFGDGGPHRVLGLRAFVDTGMFKLVGIYNSLEKRTVLAGMQIDLATLHGDDAMFGEIDMGIVSKDKPLLLVLDNTTPVETGAVLNLLFASDLIVRKIEPQD